MSSSPVRLDSAAYRRLCKRRPGAGADDVLEYIRGERAFDEPEASVITGPSIKSHLRSCFQFKSKMRNINKYKDQNQLKADLDREHRMCIEAIHVDWLHLPYPDAPPLKRKRSPLFYEDLNFDSTEKEMMTKADHKCYKK